MRGNYKKSRISAKRSKKCREHWFKKGHTLNKGNKRVCETPSENSDNSATGISVPNDLKEKTVTRLDSCLAADVRNAACCNEGILPYKLRPTAKKSDHSANYYEKGTEKIQGSNENIIVNITQLENAFRAVSNHLCKEPNLTTVVSDRKGLCISIHVKCKSCNFNTGPLALSNTIKSKQGHESGTLNQSVLLPVMSSRLGLNDVQLVLSCLNVRAPNKRGMQRKLNKLSDKIQILNENQLDDNQQYVKNVQYLAQTSAGTDIEYDVSYTSRPKADQTTATQCFAPVLEKTTVKHLPVDIQIANKLCSLKNCNHENTKCKKNFAMDTSINQAESILLKKSIKSITDKKILSVKTVTTDGSPQLAKAIREINAKTSAKVLHYKCFVHNMRNVHKHLKAVKLKPPTGKIKSIYTQQVATSIRCRIRAELRSIKLFSSNMDQYLLRAQMCIDNILRCSTNDHSRCRKCSMICTAHLKKAKIHKHMRYLPEQKYMQLSTAEINTLQKVIDKYFGKQQLQDTARFFSTNACESLHSRLFQYAPKNTVWSRNFPGLCHSVTLAASIGRGVSLLRMAQEMGIVVAENDPFYKFIQSMDKTAHYYASRRRTFKYKSTRYLNRKKKAYRSVLSGSVYGSETIASIDHAYGINLRI